MAHFEASGYDARPFYKTADLLASAAAQRYDGFVVDWIVGETSVIKLNASLREQDATCPIVVLTAQVVSGVVDEQDIADAVKRYDLVFSEKPVRTSILTAMLTRAFAAASSETLEQSFAPPRRSAREGIVSTGQRLSTAGDRYTVLLTSTGTYFRYRNGQGQRINTARRRPRRTQRFGDRIGHQRATWYRSIQSATVRPSNAGLLPSCSSMSSDSAH